MRQDIRVTKTKRALRTALVKLLKENRIEKITTTELCKEAEINRSTFYDYYSNPQECFDEYALTLISDVKNMTVGKQTADVGDFLREYLTVMKQNQEVFRAIHHSSIHNPVIIELVKNNCLCEEIMMNNEEKKAMLMSYYLHGFYGIVAEWLNNGCKESIDDIIEVCYHVGRTFENSQQK